MAGIRRVSEIESPGAAYSVGPDVSSGMQENSRCHECRFAACGLTYDGLFRPFAAACGMVEQSILPRTAPLRFAVRQNPPFQSWEYAVAKGVN